MAREARHLGIVRDRVQLRQDPALVDEPRRRRRDARGHPSKQADDRVETLGADADRQVAVRRARLLRAGGCPRPVRVLRLPHRAPPAGEPREAVERAEPLRLTRARLQRTASVAGPIAAETLGTRAFVGIQRRPGRHAQLRIARIPRRRVMGRVRQQAGTSGRRRHGGRGGHLHEQRRG